MTPALQTVLDVLAWAIAAIVLVPGVVLAVQLWAAPRRIGDDRQAAHTGRTPRIAVVVPAHDEAGGIAPTLRAIRTQLTAGDRLLVVADNCSDDTAGVARAEGAEVLERTDPVRRGKGYALDAGVRALAGNPPDVVVFVDADCDVQTGSLARLGRAATHLGAPVQALYLMHAPTGAPLGTRIAAYAWIVRNAVRPAGAARLGWPCQLMGTGMALPWPLAETAPLASGHLVEDMQLGLALARAGTAPRFVPAAVVTSHFPLDRAALRTQRTRWEHGHLSVALGAGLPLLGHGLLHARGAALALALDVLVPPLAAWVVLAASGLFMLGAWAAFGGSAWPAVAVLSVCVLAAAGLLRAWWQHARKIVSGRELLRLPLYVLGKLPLYARLLRGRQGEWVRTARDNDRR